jgi:hypothetical protein
MLGFYRMAAQLVASRVVLTSTESVSPFSACICFPLRNKNVLKGPRKSQSFSGLLWIGYEKLTLLLEGSSTGVLFQEEISVLALERSSSSAGGRGSEASLLYPTHLNPEDGGSMSFQYIPLQECMVL